MDESSLLRFNSLLVETVNQSAEITIVKYLFQERDNGAWVRVEPQPGDHGRCMLQRLGFDYIQERYFVQK